MDKKNIIPNYINYALSIHDNNLKSIYKELDDLNM